MKYIVYRSSEGDRKIIILDGQPYYQSTGKNSKMPGIWLPFIACMGSVQLDMSRYPTKYIREHIFSVYSLGHGHIIKKSLMDSVLSDDEKSWCLPSLEKRDQSSLKQEEVMPDEEKDLMSEREEIKSDDFSRENIFDRLFLKKDLVNSLRLNNKIIGEIAVIAKEAGLDEEQTQLAETPLILSDQPELVSEDPNEVNRWLIQNGATYISEMTRTFPDSYEKIWNGIKVGYQSIDGLRRTGFFSDAERADKLERAMELKQVIAILSDYTKNNSALKRFFYCHWNRSHTKLVSESIVKKYGNAFELITDIRCSLHGSLKLDGSLEKRLTFMEQKLIVNPDKARVAIGSLWQWQEKNNQTPDIFSQYSMV